MFKVNNKDTRQHIPHLSSSIFAANFEQMNAGWGDAVTFASNYVKDMQSNREQLHTLNGLNNFLKAMHISRKYFAKYPNLTQFPSV